MKELYTGFRTTLIILVAGVIFGLIPLVMVLF